MRRLHGMASRFVREGNLAALLSDAIDAAMAIAGADVGFIATLTGSPAALNLVAHRGCERSDASGSLPLARALHDAHLARDERIVVRDTQLDQAPGELQDLLTARGIRAFQSTPLRSPSGELLGLVTTQHRRPWQPQEAELHLLDLIARRVRRCHRARRIDRGLRPPERARAGGQAARDRGAVPDDRREHAGQPDSLQPRRTHRVRQRSSWRGSARLFAGERRPRSWACQEKRSGRRRFGSPCTRTASGPWRPASARLTTSP